MSTVQKAWLGVALFATIALASAFRFTPAMAPNNQMFVLDRWTGSVCAIQTPRQRCFARSDAQWIEPPPADN